MPVLIDGAGNAHEPVAIFSEFQNVSRRKKFDAVRRWIAKRLEQSRHDQRRHIMRLAIKHPGRLLRRQPGRQLAQDSQKLLLVVSHFNVSKSHYSAVPKSAPPPPRILAARTELASAKPGQPPRAVASRPTSPVSRAFSVQLISSGHNLSSSHRPVGRAALRAAHLGQGIRSDSSPQTD